jgi:hypothetical protein
MTLPVGLITFTPAEHVEFHNEIHSALPTLGLPTTLTMSSLSHINHHDVIHLFVGGLPDVFAGLSGHVSHHNAIHGWVNQLESLTRYGPKPEHTKPAGAIDVSVGSLTQALLDAQPTGTKFWLLSGIHRPVGILLPKANQELHGQFGAVISGSKELTGWIVDGSRWYVAGQTQRMPVTSIPDALQDPTNYPRAQYGDDLFRNKVPLRHVDSLGALVSGTYFFDYTANRVYVADDPTGQLIEICNVSQALRAQWSEGVTGVLLKNLVIEGYGCAIQTAAVTNSGETQDCLIQLMHGIGISQVDGGKIRRSKIHMIGQLGVGGPGVSGGNKIFEDNELCHCNYARVAPGFEAGGSKWATPTAAYPSASWVLSGGSTIPDHVIGTSGSGLHARRNYGHDNRGSFLWADIDVDKVLYEDNIAERNAFGSFTQEIGFDFIMRRNKVREGGIGAADSGISHDDFLTAIGPDPLRWADSGTGSFSHVAPLTGNAGELKMVSPVTLNGRQVLLSKRGVLTNQEILIKMRRVQSSASPHLVLRADNNTSPLANGFIFEITFPPTGMRAYLYKREANVSTFIDQVGTNDQFGLTDIVWFRFQVEGTSPNITLRARWWKDGTEQPTAWTKVVTGVTGPDSGAVRIENGTGGDAGSLPSEVLWSNLRIDNMTTTTATSFDWADRAHLLCTESGAGWIYDNTLRDCWGGEVGLVDFGGRPQVVNNVKVYNNDITNTRPLVFGGGGRVMTFSQDALNNCQIFGNHYHVPDLTQLRWAKLNASPENMTWAQWQAAGFDTTASGGTADTNI